jgi:hypothetical protein
MKKKSRKDYDRNSNYCQVRSELDQKKCKRKAVCRYRPHPDDPRENLRGIPICNNHNHMFHMPRGASIAVALDMLADAIEDVGRQMSKL